MNIELLADRIRNGKPLDFGTIFNNSFQLFKQVWVQGFIIVLLTFVTIVPLYLILYIPLLAMGVLNSGGMEQGADPIAILMLVVAYVIVIFGGVMISIALNAAFLRICRLKDANEMGDESYFLYLKGKYLKKTFVLALIILGLSVVGMLTCGLGIFYLVVPMSLFPAFLAFNEELDAMGIAKASFQLGHKNWWVIFGLLLVMGMVAQLGFILCFVGILFTMMLARVPLYYIYKYGVGFSSDEPSEHDVLAR